jgi:hypothetical protein
MDSLAGRRRLVGAFFWLAAAVAAAAAAASLAPPTRERLDHVKVEMARAVFDPAPTFTILYRGGTVLERGNGVLAIVDGKLERIGEVVRVRPDGDDASDVRATIAIDEHGGTYRPAAGTVGVRRSQGRSFLFALQTLLPASQWERVRTEWTSFRARNAEELSREIEPLAGQLLATTLRAVAAELPDALERHRADLDRVVTRMRNGLGEEQVRPLLIEDLWPIVVRNAAGPAEQIGRELWDRVPLMSFALRAAADRLLEDEPVRVEERWNRFVQEEALPTIRAHLPELEQAFAAIVKEVLASEDVQSRTAAVWAGIRDDPAVQALARTLTRELLADNARLNAALRALADDPATRERVARIGARFQEFLDPLGDLIFLDESRQGINPDLAYLIRLLLLRRDEQVVYLEAPPAPDDVKLALLPPGSELPGRHEP